MKSKVNICQEWFWNNKKEDVMEFDFLFLPIDEVYDIEDVKITNQNTDCILGEDNREGILNQLCDYLDWYLEEAVNDFEATKKRLWDEYNITKYIIQRAEKNLSNSKYKCSPYQVPMSKLTKFDGKQTKEDLFWNWKEIEEQTKNLTEPNQKKIVVEMFKAIHSTVNEYNRVCDKIMSKGKLIKHSVSQEGILDIFKKKPEVKPISKWNFYTLFIYVKFYNKNFINLYKKAAKEYAGIVKTMVSKYGKYTDEEVVGYAKARKEFEKEVINLTKKFLSSNKSLFEKTKNILKGVCDGIEKVKYPLAASSWVSDGEYNPESRGAVYLDIYGIREEAEDGIYNVWEVVDNDVKFKNIAATSQKVILNQLLKEVKDVIEPNTDISVPGSNLVNGYNSRVFGEYEESIPADIIPKMLYSIHDQGMYLHNPDTDKSELEEAIQQCLNQVSLAQEEFSVATEFIETLKSALDPNYDKGHIVTTYKNSDVYRTSRCIKNEIMPVLLGAYSIVQNEIERVKFWGKKPNNDSIYLKEFQRRNDNFESLVENAIENISNENLDKAKKGLKTIQTEKIGSVKTLEGQHRTAKETATHINSLAKTEQEINTSGNFINILLMVKLLRTAVPVHAKSKNGIVYIKILKDLKNWLDKNLTITYEQEGRIIKTVKI